MKKNKKKKWRRKEERSGALSLGGGRRAQHRGFHGYIATRGGRQRAGRTGRRTGSSRYSLEEVFLAIDAAGTGEAALGQLHLAVGALEARAVPVSVQHLEDEFVQDVLAAAGALRDLCGDGGESGSATPASRGASSSRRPGWRDGNWGGERKTGRGRKGRMRGRRVREGKEVGKRRREGREEGKGNGW